MSRLGRAAARAARAALRAPRGAAGAGAAPAAAPAAAAPAAAAAAAAGALPLAGAAAAAGAAALFGFSASVALAEAARSSPAGASVRAARAPAAASSANEAGKKAVDYAAIRAAIEAALEDVEDMRPTLVRLAWHLSGTYDKATKTGGSEGATMRFAPESEHGANAGLGGARDFLEPIKARFPACTYADLYTLAGVVAIEAMGGPQIGWRPGRRDFADGAQCTPDGRLPDANKGTLGDTVRHVKAIFARMGFDTQETVALIGAHAMGRCHTSASGYDGPYTLAPTAFSNDCYARLLEERWTLRQWNGPDQFESEDKALMMLPADMALVWDAEMRGWVELYAQDYDAWASDFARAFQKLEELGVKQFDPPWWSLNKWGDEAWFRKSLLW